MKYRLVFLAEGNPRSTVDRGISNVLYLSEDEKSFVSDQNQAGLFTAEYAIHLSNTAAVGDRYMRLQAIEPVSS